MKHIIIVFLFIISCNLISQEVDDSKENETNNYLANIEYENTFKYGTPSQKISVINKIKINKNEADIKMIANHYPKEINNRVKSEIINFFRMVKNDNAKYVIEYAIKDKNDIVRRDAYLLCSIYPDDKFENYIVNEITNAKGVVLDSMINALGAIGSTIASDYLIEQYNENIIGSTTKVEILRYFSLNKDPKGENICVKAAQNIGESALVRYMGIIAMGAYPNYDNYNILQDLLAQDLPEITARIIYILPQYSDYGDVKKDIVEAAKNDSDSVRIYAIKALKNYKNDTDIEELLLYRLKNDNSESITIEIINLYDDAPPIGNMLEAIKKLSTSASSQKVKDLAKNVLKTSYDNTTTTEK